MTIKANSPVIVRCKDAGVHFGYLESYTGREVHLQNSRRMWYWVAAEDGTLSSCAKYGVKNTSKFGPLVTDIILMEACEIILCTEIAAASLEDTTWTK